MPMAARIRARTAKSSKDSKEKWIAEFLGIDDGGHAHQARDGKFGIGLSDGVVEKRCEIIRVGIREKHDREV